MSCHDQISGMDPSLAETAPIASGTECSDEKVNVMLISLDEDADVGERALCLRRRIPAGGGVVMQRLALQPGPGLVRLLLATIVVISHMSAFNLGRPAVMLFFIFSGFWVTRVWKEWAGGPLGFMASRGLRIYPLFLVVALANAVLMALRGADLPADLGLALLVPGIASRGETLLGVDWSLDIELQFYLALPLLGPALMQARRAEVWVLAAAGWLVGVSLMAAGIVSALFYLPAFAAGIWLASTNWRATGGQALGSLLLFVVVGAVLFLLPETRALVLKESIETPGIAVQLGHLAWSLLLLPAIAWNVVQPSDKRDRWMGDLSYSLYLVHVPVITTLAVLLPHGGAATKLALLAVSFLAAIALYHWVDKPAELWRRAHFRNPLPLPGQAVAASLLNSPGKRPN